MTAPLDGIVVADFSRVLAGPLATMHLADLGARVIKIERPGSGDETRSWGPPWTTASSAYFGCVNRGKESVALDLTDESDLALAHDLVRRADVVIENFLPGRMADFGLDYDAVAAANPGVVYCSVTGFGADAGADRPGYDFLVQAVGGLMSVTGPPDGDPMKVGVALVDVLTGKDAVIGILAALTNRRSTGRGDHVQVSLLTSLLGGLVNQAASYLATGVAPGRRGNEHPSIAPYETLRCADGPVAVACGNDRQFRRLAGTLGLPGLADDPRFATNPARVEHRRALITEIERVTVGAPAAEWERRLTGAGVPAGLVEDIGAAVTRADSYGLRPLTTLTGGERQIRHPVLYRHAVTPQAAPPPALGEHTATVRSWLRPET